ncbi:MAG: hypothetical protein R3C56_13865 [Pirellulaceae bacterium]
MAIKANVPETPTVTDRLQNTHGMHDLVGIFFRMRHCRLYYTRGDCNWISGRVGDIRCISFNDILSVLNSRFPGGILLLTWRRSWNLQPPGNFLISRTWVKDTSAPGCAA